ncbi:MAG: hypothetical protein H8D67_04130 [Deltaproteobacteria bacterium]|nr:hypothetical protein [Deltaproteobacteria bacterium]
MIPEPPLMEKIPPAERFSSQRLIKDIKTRGVNGYYFSNTDQLLGALLGKVRASDVILIMSNGAFDNLPKRLLDLL